MNRALGSNAAKRRPPHGTHLLLTAGIALLASASPAAAAPVQAPIIGEVERITINNPADHWSGGTMVIGGQTVIVPRNLLLDLPANRLTLQELFLQAPARCIQAGETGLAKGDSCNASLTGAIVSISANRTNAGNVIAGDIFIQKGIEAITGPITYINYDEGYFRMSGNPGDPTTGVMVRLNDPDGRHTVQRGLGCAGGPNCSPDPRFTLDGDNYTNTFTTGYPMCIPSTVLRTFADVLGLGTTTAQALPDGTGDVLCPQTNRPLGDVAADSRRFAPIKLGDNVGVEGNFETVNGVRFLSAHTSMTHVAVTTSAAPNQPDYMFLIEAGIDAAGYQNQRVRSLFIGFTTLRPSDVLLWSLHYDPGTNSVHEFPLGTTRGCDLAAGPGTCSGQGIVASGADIFKIVHDVDFIAGAKPRVNPCAHLRADPRMGGTSVCPVGGSADANTTEMLGILVPIPHEIQARTGRKWQSLQPGGTPLVTIDLNGNEATNGQYLFPFGANLGGIGLIAAEMVEVNLANLQQPFNFSGIPWLLDRRLSPAGCIDVNGDGIPDCETTPQPLDPFPYEGQDPRLQANVPSGRYTDRTFTASPLTDARDRILSFVDPARGNFNGDATVLAFPPADPPLIPITPVVAVIPGGANKPPVAFPDSATTNANTPVLVDVLLNDTDAEGDPLTLTATTQGANGSATIVGTSVRYRPNLAFSGTDSFVYTISDGRGTSTTTVTITVNPPPPGNVAPIASDDLTATPEDTAVDVAVLANDSDANGDVLSVLSVTQGAGGTVSINPDGITVHYVPALNFNGADSFTYVVSDGVGGTATGTVFVTVTPVNDAPVAVDDAARAATATATTILVLANDTDIDGNVLSVTAVGAAANGTVVNTGTAVTYTSNAGFTGADTFTYTVSDGNGGTATATVSVTVVATIDQITVARAQFRNGREWRIDGTGSVPGRIVTIHRGSTLAGTVIGTATVDAAGRWSFLQQPAIVLPAGATTISVESTGGGQLLAVPLVIR